MAARRGLAVAVSHTHAPVPVPVLAVPVPQRPHQPWLAAARASGVAFVLWREGDGTVASREAAAVMPTRAFWGAVPRVAYLVAVTVVRSQLVTAYERQVTGFGC